MTTNALKRLWPWLAGLILLNVMLALVLVFRDPVCPAKTVPEEQLEETIQKPLPVLPRPRRPERASSKKQELEEAGA